MIGIHAQSEKSKVYLPAFLAPPTRTPFERKNEKLARWLAMVTLTIFVIESIGTNRVALRMLLATFVAGKKFPATKCC